VAAAIVLLSSFAFFCRRFALLTTACSSATALSGWPCTGGSTKQSARRA
jgi:hypothetical protein